MNQRDFFKKLATKKDIIEAFEKTADQIFKKVKIYVDKIFLALNNLKDILKIQNRKIKELEKELVASQLHQEELAERLESLEQHVNHKEHLN